MNTATKTLTAKFPGTCPECGVSFPRGATIAYNGKAWHPECLDGVKAATAAEYAREDAENAAFQMAARAEYLSGGRIRSTLATRNGFRGFGEPTFELTEVLVYDAPSWQMAIAEARAFCCSVRAAGGTADLLYFRNEKTGKRALGARELRSGGEYSSMTYHEGWAFRVRVAVAQAA